MSPEEIALKVLADVAPQREAVEQLQKASFVQSRKKTHILRTEQIQQRIKSSPDGHGHSPYSSSSANSSRRASPASISQTGDMILCRHTPSPSDKSSGIYASNSSSRSSLVCREYSPTSLGRSNSPNVGKSSANYPNCLIKKESHPGGSLWMNMTEKQLDSTSNTANQFSSSSSIGKSINGLAKNKNSSIDGHSDLTSINPASVSSTNSGWSKGTQDILTSLSSSQLDSFNHPNNQTETISSCCDAVAKPPIAAKPQLRQTNNSAFKCLPSGESNSKIRSSLGQQDNQSNSSNEGPGSQNQSEKEPQLPKSFDTVVLVHTTDLPASKSNLGTFSTFSSERPSITAESPEYSVLEPEVFPQTIPSHADKRTVNPQLDAFAKTERNFQLKNSAHSEFKDSVCRKTIPDYTTVLPAMPSSESENADSNANQFFYPRLKATHSSLKRCSDPIVLEVDSTANSQVNNQTKYLSSSASDRSSEGKGVQKRVCFKDIDNTFSSTPSPNSPTGRGHMLQSYNYQPMDNLRYSDFPLAPLRPDGNQSHFSSALYPEEQPQQQQSSSVNVESKSPFSRHSYSQLTNGRPLSHAPLHLPSSSFSHSANNSPPLLSSGRPVPPPRSTSIVRTAKTNNGVSPPNHRKSKVLQISKC